MQEDLIQNRINWNETRISRLKEEIRNLEIESGVLKSSLPENKRYIGE